MRVLVTGGAGFIGSNLVARLIADGDHVTVLDNLSSGYESNLPTSKLVRFLKGDVRDTRAVHEAARDAEVVFHLAASVGNKRSIDNPIEDSEINVVGTLRILEAVREYGVEKIVVSSSAGIFGELKTLPISEDHPVEPDTPYGASKLAEEKLSLAYAKLYPLQAVALRYFNVYGRNQRFDAYGNVIPIFARRILRGEPVVIFGDGEQTRDFVNVSDVVAANLAAARTAGVRGAFNVGSGTRVTINELTKLMIELSGISVPIEYALPRRGDVRDSQANIAAAHDAFGFAPQIELRSGLEEYLTWARESSVFA